MRQPTGEELPLLTARESPRPRRPRALQRTPVLSPASGSVVYFRDRLEHLGFRLGVNVFAATPRPLALRLGASIGTLFYVLDARHRRIARLNLRTAFPEKTEAERLAILRTSCRNLGRVAAEVCHLHSLTPDTLPAYVDFTDRAAWERTIHACTKRGAIVATGHFGNWELLAYAHGLLGHPITLIHRPMRNSLVDADIAALRAGTGTRALPKRAAAREAVRTLRRRGILAIPIDQNQTASLGVFVRFFGQPACTTAGVARLARVAKVPVYPVFLVRDGESERHRITVCPPVEDADGDDVVATTQRCTGVLEEMIRRYPEQWIWFHKRWRTRPPGEPEIY